MGALENVRKISAITTVLLSLLLVLTVAPSAPAQQVLPCSFQSEGNYEGSYSKVSKKGPYEIREQEIFEIESELDGAAIQLGVVRPDVPEGMRVPVILIASVYFHPLQTMDLRACEPFLTENYVPYGYAVGFLAVRGTADSGGCMNLMGPGERADINQAVTWLGEQEWSTGSVGMIGQSYDGATQWEAASFRNPHLKTIVPISGVPDVFELMYGDGMVDWRGPAILNELYYSESTFFYAPGRSPEHTVEVFACPEYATGTAASIYSGLTAEMDPFGYWAERRYIPDILKNYRGSIYLVQGLQDWNVNPAQQFPWIWQLEKKGLYIHYLLGQWGHAPPHAARPDWADVLLEWWDRWLKNDKTAQLGPRVQVQDNTDLWRNAARWPAGRELEFHLNPGHTLALEPSKDEASEMIANDPVHTQPGYSTSMPPDGLQNVCEQPSCTYFESEPFDEEFRVSGLPELNLNLVPEGPGGQLSAYLYAATDEGFERIGWAQANLRYPDESDQPKAVTPGQEMEFRVSMQPLDGVVPAGGRLFLVVSGGTAWNRLPGIPNNPIELIEGGSRATLTLIQALPKKSDFFTPEPA